jgi:uncharacterized protein YgbK (DUF1537 family)
MMNNYDPLERPFEETIKAQFYGQQVSLVIVDDDPTGTQTAHDVPVLGAWSEEAFIYEFNLKTPLFFVLANTRSLPREEATSRAMEIGQNLLNASTKTGRKFVIVSRSDSTLRGYFPSEVSALSQSAGMGNMPVLLIPAFFEGGRITENNVHYILEGETKTPVSETVFAQDKSFGYVNSDLTKWIEEKTGGSIKQQDVKSLTLADIHAGVEVISERLNALKPNDIMVINSRSYRDLEMTCLAIHALIKEGRGFNFRTAASFVSAFAGIAAKPWQPNNASGATIGGLTIVGSYVKKSTSQLEHLLEKDGISSFAISVDTIINDSGAPETNLNFLVENIARELHKGIDVVVYTSRELISGANAEESLAIGEKVTDFLVQLVAGIHVQPAFIIAKGGITSNDLAVKGLGMKRAIVLGQVIPGVPVWQLGKETKFPETPYVVFPGNVGDEMSLARVYDLFTENQTGA